MNRPMKRASSSFARWAMNLVARSLAVASVFLLGRSGTAAAQHVETTNRHITRYAIGQGLETQISYVQIGQKDGEDWPPPRPE